ncbi:MAG: TfoX/Sxy family protein [Planctomycetota bacterium]|jgi:TfoX/Sxy family transcriptional regulator of competence genes
MAYNEKLESKIEQEAKRWKGMTKKKMFGGICYLFGGNMSFGIWKDQLIVRMKPEEAQEKLKKKGVKPFDVTGKVMKGWVMVDKGGWTKAAGLKSWLEIGKKHAKSLPAKK